MPLTPDKYRHHFEGLDLTQEQITAMCEAICTVAEAFADRAFGIYPALTASNDNDSVSKNNVIQLFQTSANNQNEEPSAIAGQSSRERRRKRI